MPYVTGFKVLDCTRSDDRSIWLGLWRGWPDREVGAHPNYAPMFAAPGDRIVCAALGSEDSGVLFPLILRPLAREPWAPTGETLWDATSPYGYGGPFCWRCSVEDVTLFWSGLRRWATEEGAIALFARLSLFPDQLAPFDGQVADNAPNVVRFLDLDEEALWRDYAHKVRKNVNRARASGLRVEIDEDGRRLDEFLEIYYATMGRREAQAGYYFPREFFARICSDLNSQFVFFHVLSGDVVVSTELVLVSARHIYSFLGGTRAEAFELRPNDLLKHEVILWGRRTGKRAYVLGGGYGGPDGIFRYKLSFAPRGEVPFRTGQIIFDHGAYSNLVAARMAWERAQGREWQPRAGFFPAYRA